MRLFVCGYSLLAQKKSFRVFENMEFNLLVGDMLFLLTCKFEMAIFKIVQVMIENIRFAFLYVLSTFNEQIFIVSLFLDQVYVYIYMVDNMTKMQTFRGRILTYKIGTYVPS